MGPRRVALAAWLCMLAVPASAGGAAPAEALDCAGPAVALVQQRYEGVRNLRARFVQTSHSVALGAGRPGAASSSRGRVVFAVPGRMRWEYQAPEPSLVVSDGSTLWIHDPVRREAQRLAMAGEFLSGAGIQFLLGEGDLLAAFEVKALACEAGHSELELVPREPASYERLMLRVDAGSGDVLRTEIQDLLGNRTRVDFDGIEVNAELEPGLFRFEPPEGTRVIELGGSEG